MSAFGSGPSNGQFWYGSTTNFPGFLYKKNVGVGGRRSTKMGPGGNITCNSSTYLYNKYKPGQGGVGASSIANRRAKNRLATVCNEQNCFPYYMTLGQYSNYTHNPNGFISLSVPPSYTPSYAPSYLGGTESEINPLGCSSLGCCCLVDGNVLANMNTSGMTKITFSSFRSYDVNTSEEGYAYLPFTGMNYYFFGTNYGDSDNSIYMTTDNAFGFGKVQMGSYLNGYLTINWPASLPAILFDFFNSSIIASYVSPPQNGTISGLKYVRIVATGTDYESSLNQLVRKAYEIYYVRDNCFQYMQFNCSIEETVVYGALSRSKYNNISNITNGTDFQNTFGSTNGSFGNNPPNDGGPQTGGSYVIRSDLNGNDWKFFPNTHLIL